jgi:hypothetical protein
LYNRRNRRAHAHTRKAVIAYAAEQFFYSLACAALQAVAHHLHARHENAASRKQHQYAVENLH